MQVYKAPTADLRFIYETFGYDRVQGIETFEDFDLDTVIAILEESGKFCTKEMLPLNRPGDQEGVHYDPETMEVTTPKGFKELYKKYLRSGMGGIAMPREYGGGGAPHALARKCKRARARRCSRVWVTRPRAAACLGGD